MSDIDDERSVDFDYNRDSNEDTEDASETDNFRQEDRMIAKEQKFNDTMKFYKTQLSQLYDKSLPEYVKMCSQLEAESKEEIQAIKSYAEYIKQNIEQEYKNEVAKAREDFENKKTDLKNNLMMEFEEKRKMIEMERNTLDINSDCLESKPVVTRKLRRRPNDPIPKSDSSKRKYPPSNVKDMDFLLDENLISEDLKIIARPQSNSSRGSNLPSANSQTQGNSNKVTNLPSTNSLPTTPKQTRLSRQEDSKVLSSRSKMKSSVSKRYEDDDEDDTSDSNEPMSEVRIEDGKLFFDKKWFYRGQSIYLESKDMPKTSAAIMTIANTEVYVKTVPDGVKHKLVMSQLTKGKYVISRRIS